MNIQTEVYSEIREELENLVADHHKEIPMVGIDLKMDADHDMYDTLHKLDRHVLITLRNDHDCNNDLLGYLSLFVSPHHHHKSIMFATTDMFYVVPEYRNAGTGRDLFRLAEELLKEKYKVRYVQMICNANNRLQVFAEKSGYHQVDIVYVKDLGE